MNSKNNKTSKSNVLKLKLRSKLDIRIGGKVFALSNLNIYYTWSGFCSVSDIQDYFKYIFKKDGENINKPSVQIYVKKIENRIKFKIKDG